MHNKYNTKKYKYAAIAYPILCMIAIICYGIMAYYSALEINRTQFGG